MHLTTWICPDPPQSLQWTQNYNRKDYGAPEKEKRILKEVDGVWEGEGKGRREAEE